jgi:putative flavoprotein involved in K+ transport
MPEVELTIRWADGHTQSGRSPSRAIERWLVERAVYPRHELTQRVRHGLAEASERVRQRYGHTCTAAAQLSDELLAGAAEHGGDADAPATVQRLRQVPPPMTYPPARPPGEIDVVVVGGGQAGLAVSWHLRHRGVEHVVLERDRIAGTWRKHRWDTFCLVTPNWQCRLPEFPYRGDDPDGFMGRDQIVDYVESFAASFDPPVHEGVAVHRVAPADGPGFLVQTSHGELRAKRVVLCVGGYHEARLPEVAAQLPPHVTQLHSSGYRNPSSLPSGATLVVGSGQSGAQIAEDLLLAGRQTHLSVGSAPRVARLYRGRDCVAWLEDIGHYDMPVDEHPQGTVAARHEPNHYVTGRNGGHDIDLRAHALAGLQLHGRLQAFTDGRLRLGGDLREKLDAADCTAERIKDTIDRWIDEQGIDAPTEERYRAVWEPADDNGSELDLNAGEIRSVVWATGFASDWSFVDVPGFTDDGYPRYTRGVCDVADLYVLGLPWLYTWGSGRFAGVDRDAKYVAEHITARARVPTFTSVAR